MSAAEIDPNRYRLHIELRDRLHEAWEDDGMGFPGISEKTLRRQIMRTLERRMMATPWYCLSGMVMLFAFNAITALVIDVFLHWNDWRIIIPMMISSACSFAIWRLAFRYSRRQIIYDMLRSMGRCPHCGYLIATSNYRCPECGRVAPAVGSSPE